MNFVGDITVLEAMLYDIVGKYKSLTPRALNEEHVHEDIVDDLVHIMDSRPPDKPRDYEFKLSDDDVNALAFLSGGDMCNDAASVYEYVQHDLFNNIMSEVGMGLADSAGQMGGKQIETIAEESMKGGKRAMKRKESTSSSESDSSDDEDYSDYSDIDDLKPDVDEYALPSLGFIKTPMTGGSKRIYKPIDMSAYFIRKLREK